VLDLGTDDCVHHAADQVECDLGPLLIAEYGFIFLRPLVAVAEVLALLGLLDPLRARLASFLQVVANALD
jgi:hypothetical protein